MFHYQFLCSHNVLNGCSPKPQHQAALAQKQSYKESQTSTTELWNSQDHPEPLLETKLLQS